METLAQIQDIIQYAFNDVSLLQQALVHCSYVNEVKEGTVEPNERLEFLGDAVLDLLVSEYLYRTFPEKQEGELSQLRAQLVDASACIRYITQWDIVQYCQMGRGQKQKSSPSIGADLFEAILGAMYLDGGLEVVRSCFLQHFTETLQVLMAEGQKNYKRLLQEFVAQKFQTLPIYKIENETGPDHEKVFTVSVYVVREKWGEGVGFSKKEAEQKAAAEALKRL